MILFRADASYLTGVGHVARCLTLASELRDLGERVIFACREQPGHLLERIIASGFEVRPMRRTDATSEDWLGVPEDEDATELLDVAGDLLDSSEVRLVVDHYRLSKSWERRLRPKAQSILVIDDLADRPHDCDLLLDQNLHPSSETRYPTRVPAECELLLGPHFALLRPDFREQRALGIRDRTSLRRIFVNYGGVDLPNMTGRTLRALTQVKAPHLEVEVVLGGRNPHRDELRRLAATDPRVECHDEIHDMAVAMNRCDLAISAGGGTTWERCCMGLPSLVIAIAENQVGATRECHDRGIHRMLGDVSDVKPETITRAIEELLADWSWALESSRAGLALVDGLGAARVAKKLLGSP